MGMHTAVTRASGTTQHSMQHLQPAVLSDAPGSTLSHAVGIKRLSMAHMGLLAAPDAALLPGSPLGSTTAAVTAGSSGALAWDAAGSREQGGGARLSSAHHAGLSKNLQATALGQHQLHGYLAATGAAGTSTRSLLAPHLQHSSSLGRSTASIAASQTHSSTGSQIGREAPVTGSSQHSTAGTTSCSAASINGRVSAAAVSQQGTAAFKGPDRNKACLAGRCSGTEQAGLPGPGQFWPQHAAVDKHVPGVSLAAGKARQAATAPRNTQAHKGAAAVAALAATATASKLSTADLQLQQRQQKLQQQRGSQDAAIHRASTAGPEAAGRRSSACTAASPRSAAEEDADNDGDDVGALAQAHRQGKQHHMNQHGRQAGTAAFKTVSRDQREAVATGRSLAACCGSSSGPQQQQQPEQQHPYMDHSESARPVSRGPE